MTKRTDDLGARLERLIAELAEADAPGLLDEARASARARARAVLEEALTEQLLRRAAGAPERDAPPRRRAEPRREREPEPTPEPEPERRTEERGTGYYAYGVVAADTELPGGLAGVSPSGVGLVADGTIAAVVTPVPLAEFGEEALRENLNRMEWLERTARAHEAVVDRLVAHTTLVPLRLCTVFHSEDGVRDMLRRERAALDDALVRLEGTTEWGVKAIADRDALARAAHGPGEEPAPVEPLDEGARYLAERRRAQLAQSGADALATTAVNEAHARLAEAARAAVVHPAQSRELSGYEGDMLLNGSYLVEDDRLDEFRELVDALDARYRDIGLTFELTGPWAPYNFVTEDDQR